MSPKGDRGGKTAGRGGSLLLGRIQGVHGLKGWVKVYSYTERREAIVDYSPWTLEHQGRRWSVDVLEGRRHGKTVIARLEGCDDCDRARSLMGARIYVERDRLPAPADEEYYWHDLIGCEVVDGDGLRLGRVSGLIATGANDVLVVAGERERLIPFVQGDVVTDVDVGAGRLTVDWPADF